MIERYRSSSDSQRTLENLAILVTNSKLQGDLPSIIASTSTKKVKILNQMFLGKGVLGDGDDECDVIFVIFLSNLFFIP
jgi:hypothetical protein